MSLFIIYIPPINTTYDDDSLARLIRCSCDVIGLSRKGGSISQMITEEVIKKASGQYDCKAIQRLRLEWKGELIGIT